MRSILIGFEKWMLDDESMLLSFGKLLLFVMLICAVIAAPFVWWISSQPAISIFKDEWDCTKSHTVYRYMYSPATHTSMPVQETVCDEYKRK